MVSTQHHGNALHGLYLLMHHTRSTRHHDQCYDRVSRLKTHPFGLDLPDEDPTGLGQEVLYIENEATDMMVEVFLAHIRGLAGHRNDNKVHRLRVINERARGLGSDQHYVIFEVWIEETILVSGRTTDFSGAGNAARTSLEDVFALLSQMYEVEIMRVTLKGQSRH